MQINNKQFEQEIKWDWMQTYTGKRFMVGKPSLDDIDIIDIAHSLSMQCRYNGHCNLFYSVAEHCCLLYDVADQQHKLWALLHDATEAYLCDIPSPVKPLLKEYKQIETNLMSLIATKFGMSGDMPQQVHWLDTAILTDEVIQNLNMSNMNHYYDKQRLNVKIKNWSPHIAKQQFLDRFYIELNKK
jgi:uncharacterized protein